VLTPKGMKEDVKKAAASQGMSTSAFILEAIKEKIATIEHS
jgi:uncharacterized protein (DUF1778 family)